MVKSNLNYKMPENQNLVTRAKEIIAKIIYITIATASKDGSPWNSPVYAAYDERYNFFWTSSPEARHSKNIAANPNVAIVIYDTNDPEGTGEGVYIEAQASELNDEQEITEALKFFYGRKNKETRPASTFLGNSPRRLYKAVPEKVWMNTYQKIHGQGIDGKIEINLL